MADTTIRQNPFDYIHGYLDNNASFDNNAANVYALFMESKLDLHVVAELLVEVNSAYSSIVGNFAYGNENTPDMVAASIEIARRAYKKFEKGWFYPKFNVETQDERWKQTLGGVKTWKNLFLKVKEAKLKYRFLLSCYIGNVVLSIFYNKRKWKRYVFA